MKSCPLYLRTTLKVVVLTVLTSVIYLSVQAQSWTQYDQGTPPQHATGVSAFGSYISTDLGTVSLSNGALNIQLPMGKVGGRGFGMPISLNYSSKVWSVGKDATQNYSYNEDQVVYAYAGLRRIRHVRGLLQ